MEQFAGQRQELQTSGGKADAGGAAHISKA
jgi:hypothetical protein